MPDTTMNEALAWLKQADGKPQAIPSKGMQARHNSEWKPTVIHKDDKAGLKKVLQEREKFMKRYPTNSKTQ